MPIVAQIEQALFQLAPKDLAFDWDNVGHLEGSPDQEVQRVLVALDVTENVVSEAEKLGCQLIVSHHPLMNVRWHQAEMQTLRPNRYLGRLLRRLVKADISVISMHTNLDIAPAASTTHWPRHCESRTLGLCRGMRPVSAVWDGCETL